MNTLYHPWLACLCICRAVAVVTVAVNVSVTVAVAVPYQPLCELIMSEVREYEKP